MNPATGNVAPVHFVNVASVKNDVYLYDEIGSAENYIDLVQALNEATENDVFHIHVATAGGDLDGCISIIHAIRSTRATVYGYADSIVASAGTIIFLSCHNWIINEFAYFMFHDGNGVMVGKLNETAKQIEAIRKLYLNIANTIYKPFFNDEEITKIMDGSDLYQTAEEMANRIDKAFPGQVELEGEEPEDGILSPVQQLNEKEDLINFENLPSESDILVDAEELEPSEYFPKDEAIAEKELKPTRGRPSKRV